MSVVSASTIMSKATNKRTRTQTNSRMPGSKKGLITLEDPFTSIHGGSTSITRNVTSSPFSYYSEVTERTNKLTLSSEYAAVLWPLDSTKVIGARLDKVTVWARERSSVVRLAVGDLFDVSAYGGNKGPSVTATPGKWFADNDENTVITYAGASRIRIEGVAYLRLIPPLDPVHTHLPSWKPASFPSPVPQIEVHSPDEGSCAESSGPSLLIGTATCPETGEPHDGPTITEL